MTKHIDEVRKFLRVRQTMRGVDQESIISVQVGGHDEAHITASGLKSICDSHDALLEALEAISSIPNRLTGPDWEEIEEAREIATAAISRSRGEQ